MKEIIHRNDWNGGQYLYGDIDISRHKMKRAIIKFPNGVKESHDVIYKTKYGSDYDMGHTYDWQKDIPHIVLKYNGQEVELSLVGLEVDVIEWL